MLTETKITWDALQALIEHAECGGAVSPDTCDALGDEIVRCEVLQNGSLYWQLLCLRLFDRGNGWEGWKSVEAWLGVKLGLPYKTANERLRVARSLARLPRIDEAFREGLLSFDCTLGRRTVPRPTPPRRRQPPPALARQSEATHAAGRRESPRPSALEEREARARLREARARLREARAGPREARAGPRT
ncbi:MAG: hypothetical protein JKY65_05425 [Planctomycetes bacterium]|nr:hypothetical protein [Planctomycetota bacterium]